MIDLLMTNATVVAEPGRDPVRTSIGIAGGEIVHVGSATHEAATTWDVEGRLVTAGLVECHTHLVFGGDRLADFSRRLSGASYEEIAAGGGGIRSTIAATQAATTEQLESSAAQRMRWLATTGVTTVEVKSGYGLDPDQELRMLQVAHRAASTVGLRLAATLLPLHVVPTDIDRARYLDLVCDEMIPAAASESLADAVDVFIEGIAFTAEEARRCLQTALDHGLAVKAHVGQFSDLGGSRLAAEFGALSVDHCEHIPVEDAPLLAEAGTVAVLVPGASLFLAETSRPPVAAFRDHGVRMAVSTDLNPGSSPLASLPLAALLAVHRFGLTPSEAFAGITTHAAAAVGVDERRGRIAPGFDADLAVWDATSPAELVYWLAAPLCHATVVGGTVHEWSLA